LGTERSVVVRGEDGLGEVTLAGPTHVIEVGGGACEAFTWTPEHFGIERQNIAALEVEGPSQSAEAIRSVLAGSAGPARDIVVLNAAAALWTAGKADSPSACAALAAAAIDRGAARELLARLAEMTNG
jgi:anthranilate phosphoribosyltransferase